MIKDTIASHVRRYTTLWNLVISGIIELQGHDIVTFSIIIKLAIFQDAFRHLGSVILVYFKFTADVARTKLEIG